MKGRDTVRSTPTPEGAASTRKVGGREERELQKRLKSLERKIAKLDEEKNAIQQQMLTATESAVSQELHEQFALFTAEVKQLEQQWLEVYHELEA